MSAIDLIEAERRRQVEQERFSAEHDDNHVHGEMLLAAAIYYHNAQSARLGALNLREDGAPVAWPWDARWWKPKSPQRDLERAGALCLAERERLGRLTGPVTTGHVDHKLNLIVAALDREISATLSKSVNTVPSADQAEFARQLLASVGNGNNFDQATAARMIAAREGPRPSGPDEKTRGAISEMLAAYDAAEAAIDDVMRPFREAQAKIIEARNLLLERYEIEIAGKCESCGKILFYGDQGHHDGDGNLFCAKDAPTWRDAEEERNEAFARQHIDAEEFCVFASALGAHLAGGGSRDDKMLVSL